MSYKINHQKHALEYLQRYTTGTPKDIAKALPKAKRTATSYSTINQALCLLVDKGFVRRVGPGTYASAAKEVAPIDVMSYRDKCCSRILEMLEPRRHYAPVAAAEIYDAVGSFGFKQSVVMRKLRQLKELGLVDKEGSRWRISKEAFDPIEWRATMSGAGFRKIDAPRTLPSPRTPSSNAILGESVPAHNILRTHRMFRDKIPATPAPSTDNHTTEQPVLTIPTPGAGHSIFD